MYRQVQVERLSHAGIIFLFFSGNTWTLVWLVWRWIYKTGLHDVVCFPTSWLPTEKFKNKCKILMMPVGRIQVHNVSEHLGCGCVWFCESIWFITAIWAKSIRREAVFLCVRWEIVTYCVFAAWQQLRPRGVCNLKYVEAVLQNPRVLILYF